MAELDGKRLAGRYQVDSFIGRGGMAEVYKVWDIERATYLALKLLREDLAQDVVFLRRFKREAENLAKLQHPNIVRFYGLNQEDILTFILMDYIEGTSLRTVIFRHRGVGMDPLEILRIMQGVCSALHFAHRSGIIHCDLKPGNILIDNNGKPMISDLGIARMSDAATATMVGIGTPAYMAPEQIHGQDPTPQTDIYALGIVLFEMLTGGERPFTGERASTTGSTSEKVRWEQINIKPPSPRNWNQNISPEMEAVVFKCLEKNPANRYKTPLDLLNALGLLLGHQKIPNAVMTADSVIEPNANPDFPQGEAQPSQPTRSPTLEKDVGDRKRLWMQIGTGLLLAVLLVTGFMLITQGQDGVGLFAFMASSTPTKTMTSTPTPSPTTSTTPSPTITLTQTPTNLPTETSTPTSTQTPSLTPSPTMTLTPTSTATRKISYYRITVQSYFFHSKSLFANGVWLMSIGPGKSNWVLIEAGTYTFQFCHFDGLTCGTAWTETINENKNWELTDDNYKYRTP